MDLSGQHKHEALRPHLWAILHDGRGLAGHAFHIGLILMIMVSLALLPLELVPQLHTYHTTLIVIEVLTAVIFTVEYVLKIYAAPDRKQFIFSLYGLIDLFSIAPFYAGLLGTQYLRAAQLLRIIRVLKLGEFKAAAAENEEARMDRGIGLLENERIEYIVTRHPFYLIVGCLPVIAFTAVGFILLLAFDGQVVAITAACSLFIFALIFFWKTWLDFGYDVIFVTNMRLILQNQYIIGRSINQVNYHAITNVIPYYPTTLSYLLRYGSIKIETTAAEPGHIEMHTVRKHEKAAHMIMEKSFESGHRPTLKQNSPAISANI